MVLILVVLVFGFMGLFTAPLQQVEKGASEIFTPTPERENECKEAFEYLNTLRVENGRRPIQWDSRAYQLAVARTKDMYERKYFDHTTPDGKCVRTFQVEYGFSSNDIIAENLGGSYYSPGNPTTTIDCKEQVDGWMSSRGHRYNLLYPDHTAGAIGCYYGICAFLGINNDPYGLGAGPCTTGEQGLNYWETVGRQPGE